MGASPIASLQGVGLQPKKSTLPTDQPREKIARASTPHDSRVAPKGQGGETPLHWAAVGADKDFVEFLVALGAEVEARGETGRTPHRGAVEDGLPSVIELLLVRHVSSGCAGQGNGVKLRHLQH